METSPRMCWIYPDRGTVRQRAMEAEVVWDKYRRIAADMGLEMSVHTPEALSIDLTKGACHVYLDGREIAPANTIVITSLYALPHQAHDVANQLFAFTILERAGFYLPVPPGLSYIATDKLATLLHLAGSPVPVVPTIRIGTGRDALVRFPGRFLADLPYPVVVKPASWGMGLGVSLVHSVEELRGVVGLAGGSDTALVVQPYLGEGVNDCRVFVIAGRAEAALTRVPRPTALTASIVNGGEAKYGDPPQALRDAISYVAGRLPMPYLAIDFLHDGKQFWLSEVEPDGALGAASPDVVARCQRPIVEARLRAYLAGHARSMRQTGELP